MKSWNLWLDIVKNFRPAFSRERTYLWFIIALAGFCCRKDILGVTSIVRVMGLKSSCYVSLRLMFHSSTIDLKLLTFPRVEDQPKQGWLLLHEKLCTLKLANRIK